MSKTERLPFSSASLSTLSENSAASESWMEEEGSVLLIVKAAQLCGASETKWGGQGGKQTFSVEQETSFDGTREQPKPMAS